MQPICTIGLDIAKNIFALYAVDASGHCVLEKSLRRTQVRAFFAKLPPAQVGIEAGCGAHFWARELAKLGHQVKLVPAQYVRPFRRRTKTDAHDAIAICDAVRHPDIPAVTPSSESQQALQLVHRLRSRVILNRTATLNQLRAMLAEFGMVFPQGVASIRRGVQRLLAQVEPSVPPLALDLARDLLEQLAEFEARIALYNARINAAANADERCSRLLAVPGFGKLAATAIVGSYNDLKQYRSARHFASSLGLTPYEHSSGGKQRLLGVSKRGDIYVRALLVHGARSVIQFIHRHDHPLARWVQQLLRRKPKNVVAVALANKMARIAWALLAKDRAFQFA